MFRSILREPRGAGAVALVVVTLLLVVTQAASGLRRVHDAAARNESFTAQHRAIVSAYGLDISRSFLVGAIRLIPRDATYAVVTGPNVQVSTPITLSALPPYAQTLLLPRRQLAFFTREAQYLLCYGCDLGEQGRGGPLQILWSAEPGLVIARRSS